MTSQSFLYRIFDKKIIDGILHGLANATGAAGRGLRQLQTGVVTNYVTLFVLGILIIVGYLILG